MRRGAAPGMENFQETPDTEMLRLAIRRNRPGAAGPLSMTTREFLVNRVPHGRMAARRHPGSALEMPTADR